MMKNTNQETPVMSSSTFVFLFLFSFLTSFRTFAQDPRFIEDPMTPPPTDLVDQLCHEIDEEAPPPAIVLPPASGPLSNSAASVVNTVEEEEGDNETDEEASDDDSDKDCLDCLSRIINQLPTDSIGGRVMVPSCFSRFELYLFYNEAAADRTPQPQLDSAPPPPPISIPSPRPGESGNSTVIVIAVVVPITVIFLLLVAVLIFRSKRKTTAYETEPLAVVSTDGDDIATAGSLQFDFKAIEAATDKFSQENKLGQGGFGQVYKVLIHCLQLVDPSFQDDYQTKEITRCIHIALLCVQEEARPTMSAVVQMLTTSSIALAKPRPPGFFFRSRDEKVEKVGPSTHTSALCSVDDASITSVAPR
ncbi:hypothetical protein F2Q70_00034930 [Brassica cretica]|uniref:Gnk2-homologous domain-containing protein n=1 Tax=Brassica cretica TaxID=69181 RepID=A0A8S9JN14_BRACR|nr:hypothetical protein F2Q70_00034930 [Brassica cretica]